MHGRHVSMSNESFESECLYLFLLRTLLDMVSRYCFDRPYWTAFRSELTAYNVPAC